MLPPFLHYAQNTLKSLAQTRQTIQVLKKWSCKRVGLGGGAALWRRFSRLVLARLTNEHANLPVAVQIARSSKIATSLKTDELEFDIVESPNHAREIEFALWFDTPLKIAVGCTHRWAWTEFLRQQEVIHGVRDLAVDSGLSAMRINEGAQG
jgi:hypothetical protein